VQVISIQRLGLVLPKLCLKSAKCGGQSRFRTTTMPPDSHSPQDAAFDINIIDPQALDTPGGLQNALRTIEAICYRGDPEISRMVEALGGRSYILEYIISGTLHMPMGPCTFPALTISSSSVGGRGIHQVLKVDSCRVSWIRNVTNDGHYWRATPPEIRNFVDICGVSICCRRTPQPPRISEKGRTLG